MPRCAPAVLDSILKNVKQDGSNYKQDDSNYEVEDSNYEVAASSCGVELIWPRQPMLRKRARNPEASPHRLDSDGD
jgi:hypothetical protein